MKDTDFKEQLYLELSKLSEGLIRENVKFIDIPRPPQVVGFRYSSYKKYQTEIHQIGIDKEKFLAALIAVEQELLSRCLDRFSSSLLQQFYKTWNEIIQPFDLWAQNKWRLEPKRIYPNNDQKRIDVRKIVKAYFKEKLPAFTYKNIYNDSGMISFVSKFDEKSNLTIHLDKGTIRRGSFLLFFGLDTPAFEVDSGIFWGGHSDFEFYSEEELLKELSVAVDFIKAFLPYFKETIRNAKLKSCAT